MESTIVLSERAAGRIRRHLAGRGPGTALRLGIRRTGCSGYAYTLDYADGVPGDDVELTASGVPIRIARDALPALTGLTVDYVRDGLNEKFVFVNPNAGDSCGCGESFTLRDAAGPASPDPTLSPTLNPTA